MCYSEYTSCRVQETQRKGKFLGKTNKFIVLEISFAISLNEPTFTKVSHTKANINIT